MERAGWRGWDVRGIGSGQGADAPLYCSPAPAFTLWRSQAAVVSRQSSATFSGVSGAFEPTPMVVVRFFISRQLACSLMVYDCTLI